MYTFQDLFRAYNFEHTFGLTVLHKWLMLYYIVMFQQKMQLKRKKKKEREALGDKVCFLSMSLGTCDSYI